MTTDEMTDEEYGRAWAAENGRTPYKDCGVWWWFNSRSPELESDIRPVIWAYMKGPTGFDLTTGRYYRTEAEAYAALGRTIRGIHQAVPHLKGDK